MVLSTIINNITLTYLSQFLIFLQWPLYMVSRSQLKLTKITGWINLPHGCISIVFCPFEFLLFLSLKLNNKITLTGKIRGLYAYVANESTHRYIWKHLCETFDLNIADIWPLWTYLATPLSNVWLESQTSAQTYWTVPLPHLWSEPQTHLTTLQESLWLESQTSFYRTFVKTLGSNLRHTW